MLRPAPFANATENTSNDSLAKPLLVEANELPFNDSQVAVAGVAQAVAENRAERWVAENSNAIDCWNKYVEENGLPLAKYRSF